MSLRHTARKEARQEAKAALAEEVETRIDAMAVTGDIPEPERQQQALEDILEMDAQDHGAYTEDEINSWTCIQEAARAEIRRIKRRKT